MKIEVLVATMNQSDFSLYDKMNLKTDVVFANQSDKYEYKECSSKTSRMRMITTMTRGVGKNRNIGLMHSEADICLLADDDVRYVDNYNDIIEKAFRELPDADIIIFNIETIGDNETSRRVNKKIKKIHMLNVLNYGAPRVAIKKASLSKKNIWFSLLYGGGAPYSSGEDSLFLTESIRKKMKIYAYPCKIADVNQEKSTWFKGYTKKYFEDKGIWFANAFPKLKYFLSVYYSFRFKRYTQEFSVLQIFSMMNTGIRKFDKTN